MTGTLYTVATPIGNLEDLSQRAINTLRRVGYILCEDKRVSAKLLSRFEIENKLIAYHKFNEKEQLERVIEDLQGGIDVALISDAGTPCISDPGRILVNELYEQGIKVTPVSGPCAVSTFLSAVPKIDEEYTFYGFIGRTGAEQEKVFSKYSNTDLIFYESPNRLVKTLENITKLRGTNAKVAVGRELTKIYEEIRVETAEKITNYFMTNPPKGEIVVMLYKKPEEDFKEADLDDKIKILTAKGFSAKDISTILSSLFNVNKNNVYKAVQELKD